MPINASGYNRRHVLMHTLASRGKTLAGFPLPGVAECGQDLPATGCIPVFAKLTDIPASATPRSAREAMPSSWKEWLQLFQAVQRFLQ